MDAAYFDGMSGGSARGCGCASARGECSDARGFVGPTELMSMDQFRRSGYFRPQAMAATYVLDSLEPDMESPYVPNMPGVVGLPPLGASLAPVMLSAVALGAFVWLVASKSSR